MASLVYSQWISDCFNGVRNIGENYHTMLVGTGYTPDRLHTVIDPGVNDATSPLFNELQATNYTGGFNGAGRLAASITNQVDPVTTYWNFAIADQQWLNLGGAQNDTIAHAILVYQLTDDTLSRLAACLEINPTRDTDGGNFTIDWATLAAGGNVQARPLVT